MPEAEQSANSAAGAAGPQLPASSAAFASAGVTTPALVTPVHATRRFVENPSPVGRDGAAAGTARIPVLEGSMDAPILYMVKAWVSPDGGERYLRWLEDKHMAEVLREPGFLWARRCRLEQTDERGWAGYLLLYGLESRDALARYLESPARARFWCELEPLDAVHSAERFWGRVDFRLESAG